jgi:acyl-CoA synthetase (AMP-forming)/AMP-acid ligase II
LFLNIRRLPNLLDTWQGAPRVRKPPAEQLRRSEAATAIEFTSLVEVLRSRVADRPGDTAYIFLPDRGGEPIRLTFAELYGRARALALSLVERGRKGDRAALLFPPGLDFVVAFFGCLLAGIIAVPMMIPRRDSSRDASAAILVDCSARFAIAPRDLVMDARADLTERISRAEAEWFFFDPPPAGFNQSDRALPVIERSDIAFLQYTSGSTSAPKGVIVSHASLLHNLEMVRIAFGNTPQSTHVSWAPHYHDLGLILNILQSLYIGALCVLLPPVSFMQRPLGWLRAIHDYRAEVAGGPNFAFELCVRRHRAEHMQGIDLSCWKLAYNGAEPVRADTIERFSSTFGTYGFNADSMHPAYGMAEAVLLISSGERGNGPVIRTISHDALQRHRAVSPTRSNDGHPIVGCGRALPGERIAIVDQENRQRLGASLIGEIWVSGPHVTQGYWRNPEATGAAFKAVIAGEDSGYWLRTGDLGFMDDTGELFITGRIKDLIIVRGVNHYPQDIENTVQDCHPGLRRDCGAAFSVFDQNREEQLIIVQEVERTYREQIAIGEVVASIREAIAREHDISAREIMLIRTATLPKTTSGKIQRSLAKQMFLTGSLSVVQ